MDDTANQCQSDTAIKIMPDGRIMFDLVTLMKCAALEQAPSPSWVFPWKMAGYLKGNDIFKSP